MTAVKLAILDFSSPYHVGWKRAEPIIEGLTIHRALISASVLIEGSTSKINALINLYVSAALPVIPAGNLYKILLPMPPIPSRVNLKKYGIRWITLEASLELAKWLQRNVYPVIVNITDTNVTVKAGSGTFKLCRSGEILHSCGEHLGEVPEGPLLEYVDRHVNRMDRATNAADVFRITGYIPRVSLGVILQGDENVVDYAFKLMNVLGELGLGGVKSRGFGRFTVGEGQFYESKLVEAGRGPGFLVVLGSSSLEPPVDAERSFIVLRTIAGYSGASYDAYILPELSFAGAGSIVFARGSLSTAYRKVETSYLGAYIVFNPVVAGVKV